LGKAYTYLRMVQSDDLKWPFVVGGGMVTMITFTVFNMSLYFISKKGYFAKYRIQGPNQPSPELYREALITAIAGLIIGTPPAQLGAWWALGDFVTNDIPSVWNLLCTILAYIFIADTFFYWSHRILHLKQFYWIHKQHHAFKTNVGFASIYTHPIEGFVNTVVTFTGPIVLGHLGYDVPLFTLWVWYVVRWAETTDAHSGYDFPWSPFGLFAVADHHDFHHSHNIGCYGSFFGLWDMVCGTDSAYKTWKAKNNARK